MKGILIQGVPLLLLFSICPLVSAQWSVNPNGQIRPIRNAGPGVNVLNCGKCDAGYTREATQYPACGRCVPINQSCGPGNIMIGNQCNPCPCPGTNPERKFGTSCKVDVDGQITCECGSEYAGRDCSQCAPGAVQTNQYPYNCIRVNSTNSQGSYCPPGNYCPPPQVPQIVQQPPPTQNRCPVNGGRGCYPPQQQLCPTNPAPVNPWPWPKPNPAPCPVPGPVCPQPVPQPCPVQPQPCPQPCPQQPCPQPCPVLQPQPCPMPYPCPPPPPPVVCPCPAPCPEVPPTQPCNNCPDPCQRCPDTSCPGCPPCPNCPQIPPCNNCPDPCPPCYGGGGDCNVTCPNPCKECPTCPDCKLNVTCPAYKGEVGVAVIPPCVCDPRGTISQYGETCFCKHNVEGRRCNSCKAGYFALTSDRGEGCLQCWGSGVSTYCTAAVYYRAWIDTSRSLDCSVELTDESNTIVYNRDSNSKFSWDGKEAKLSLTVSSKLYWSLPSCFKGNRLTSYGGILRFSRMFTGSGTSFGPDNDVIIVGGNGARLYFSSFGTQSSGDWTRLEVVLDETTHWLFYKDGSTRPATRFDILEVLADVHLILIRATWTATTMTTSIKEVQMATVSKFFTVHGFVLVIEMARCPGGYQGLSCESCAMGYYRDTTDMTASVFGACKYCPCGRNALGCHTSYGVVYCKCKPGFTGDRCQDREVITITLDPFWVRDCSGTEIDFTCSFTTNSKRTLMMRLGLESDPSTGELETRSISKTYTLSSTLGKVKCEVVDRTGFVWAYVLGATKIEACEMAIILPPKTISILADDFICVDEGDKVEMKAKVLFYGPIQVKPEWFKVGDNNFRHKGSEYVIARAMSADSGTYLVSASQGDTVDVKQITLIVRHGVFILNDDPKTLMLEGKSANGTAIYGTNSSAPPRPKPLPPPPTQFNINSMQKDGAPPPAGYPTVEVEPTEVLARPGAQVTLRCNASGEEPLKFYWKRGNSDYIPVHVRVSRGALIFKSLKKEDEGSYYCVAWNNLGQVMARAMITVDEKPAEPPLTLMISKTYANIPEGQHAFFDCSTNQENVKPMWVRKGGLELPKNSEVTENGTLIVYRVRAEDAGTYVCKAMGPGGRSVEAETTLGFIPVEPPSIPVITLSPKSPVKGRSGEQIRIECYATGNPVPNLTWSRSLDGAEKRLASTQGNVTAYEIVHLTKADEGKYTCTAVNSVGTKSESLSMTVDDAILCKANEFRCKSGDQCVPKEDRCDNERDCKDGSDEDHCRKVRARRHAPKF